MCIDKYTNYKLTRVFYFYIYWICIDKYTNYKLTGELYFESLVVK